MASRPMLRKFASRVAHNEDELIFERIACGRTMQQIANSLGCSRGMLYSFFKTSKTRQEKFAAARLISADSHAEAGLQMAHHTKPISTLKKGEATRIEDLMMVCANCHRMLHRGVDAAANLEILRTNFASPGAN